MARDRAPSLDSAGSGSGSRQSGRTKATKKSAPSSNDHVPIAYLLGGKRSVGYFNEIPNYPQSQPQHISTFGIDQTDGGDSLSSHLSQNKWQNPILQNALPLASVVDDPLLSSSLSRSAREALSRQVLQGVRPLLLGRNGAPLPPKLNDRDAVYGDAATRAQQAGGSPQNPRRRGGSPPNRPRTSGGGFGSPSPTGPVAAPDFLATQGFSSLLPISRLSKSEAYQFERARLTHLRVGPERRAKPVDAIAKEEGALDGLRVRAARLRAEAEAREKKLDEQRLFKVESLKSWAEGKLATAQGIKMHVEKGKEHDRMLKEISAKLKEVHKGTKSDDGFAQCLRTCASSENFKEAAAMSPKRAFSTTHIKIIDPDEFLLGGENGDRRGGETVLDVSDTWGDSAVELSVEINQAEGAGYLLSGSYSPTASYVSRYTQSVNSASQNKSTSFKVRRPSTKKMGSGFLVNASTLGLSGRRGEGSEDALLGTSAPYKAVIAAAAERH